MFYCSVFASIKDDKSASKHPCDRVCVAGAAPMECSYKFQVELYNTLSKACYDCPLNITDCDREHCISGDGMEKGLITVNRWAKVSFSTYENTLILSRVKPRQQT